MLTSGISEYQCVVV